MSRIAAVQMNSGDNIHDNLKLTRELIVQARAEGASLAVLPECFALMAKDHEQRLEYAEPSTHAGPIQRFLSDVAVDQDIWILAAGIFVRTRQSDLVRNATFMFNNYGECVCRYDKIHLFNVNLPGGELYSESQYTQNGTEIVVQDSPVGICGLSVCYDIRFPSLYSKLRERGATWFAIPSAFAYTTGKDHWEVLLRARAIENHAYVVAPAQWGTHPGGRRTFGNTMIVDPWGKIVAHQENDDGVVCANIDPERINSIRSRFFKSNDSIATT